jgi:GNAT superfamily N-acetyltransferase
MRELELWAPGLGYTSLRLETGVLQPPALALYRSRGWQPIERYGPYLDEPSSVCFELDCERQDPEST